ncbi:MAG: PAS domain-containing protein [Lachnospiraceae bacterium]
MRKDDIMELGAYFKSIIDQDRAAVVICSLDHKIIYMNPAAAANYHKYGGAELLGKSLLDCHGAHSNEKNQRSRCMVCQKRRKQSHIYIS